MKKTGENRGWAVGAGNVPTATGRMISLMELQDLDQRCSAVTVAGKPCRNRPLPGLKRCGVHSASAKAKSSAQRQVAPAHRPDSITEERTAHMETLLKSGSFVQVACQVVGIPYSTHKDWMEKGRADDAAPQYRIYCQRIEQARAVGEDNLVKVVASSAIEDWRAAAWMLERMEPERWGRRSVNASGGPRSDGPVEETPLKRLLAEMRGKSVGRG